MDLFGQCLLSPGRTCVCASCLARTPLSHAAGPGWQFELLGSVAGEQLGHWSTPQPSLWAHTQ